MEQFDDIQELMAEPPGGPNFGRKTIDGGDGYSGSISGPGGDDTQRASRTHDLTTHEYDRSERSGFSVVWPSNGGTRGNPGGAVVHPDEYVDVGYLRDLALEAFGFTADEIGSAYTKNPHLSADQRQLRARMGARMLALSRSGGNMLKFAEAIGLSRATVTRALTRAREAEAS
jgi:hypothetical protein